MCLGIGSEVPAVRDAEAGLQRIEGALQTIPHWVSKRMTTMEFPTLHAHQPAYNIKGLLQRKLNQAPLRLPSR